MGERLRVSLVAGEGSYAMLSTEHDVDTAVCFFHGFNGSARTTWLNFQGLADDLQDANGWWQRADLFFYGYDSVFDHIGYNSSNFLKFICSLYPKSGQEVFLFERDIIKGTTYVGRKRVDIPEDLLRNYRSLVLVGHSEGGLILRDTILDLIKKFDKELNITKQLTEEAVRQHMNKPAFAALDSSMRLFAPALMGASPSSYASIPFNVPQLGRVVRLLFGLSAAYNEMDPGSELLGSIGDQTTHFADKYNYIKSLRAQVIWARNDMIVSIGGYTYDDKVDVLQNQDHSSICKPTHQYLIPMHFVKNGTV